MIRGIKEVKQQEVTRCIDHKRAVFCVCIMQEVYTQRSCVCAGNKNKSMTQDHTLVFHVSLILN